MMKIFLYFALLALVKAQLISNGGFESTSCTSDEWCTYGTGNDIPGWTITEGTVDIQASNTNGGTVVAHSGSWSVDVSGNNVGAIAQDFATHVGDQYTVTFWLAGNVNCGPEFKVLDVSATGADTQQYTFDIGGHDNGDNMGWSQQSYTFVATATTTTLSFTSLTYTSCGPTIDDVSVTESNPAALCSQWTWTDNPGYFCSGNNVGFYECLSGPWAPQSAYFNCPAGTSCSCAVGVECSDNDSESPCQ